MLDPRRLADGLWGAVGQAHLAGGRLIPLYTRTRSREMAGGKGDTAMAVAEGRKDFFVSYTGADRRWAEWVAWALEEAGELPAGFELCPGDATSGAGGAHDRHTLADPRIVDD